MFGKLKHDSLMRGIKLLNVVMITLPFLVCWLLYYSSKIASPYYHKGQIVIILLYAILYISYCKLYNGFLISMFRISEIIYSQILAAMLSDGILYLILVLLSKKLPSAVPLLVAFAFQIVSSVIWTRVTHEWYFKTFEPLKCIVIFDDRVHIPDLIDAYGMNKKFRISRVVSMDECLKDLSVLDTSEAVFMTGVTGDVRDKVLIHCVEHDITLYTIPNFGDEIMSSAKAIHLFHLPMLRIAKFSAKTEYNVIKRVFDIVISLIGLVLCSPFILVSAIMIKITDGGTVFYKQKRLTKDGKEFFIHKLRSMRMDAEKDGIARLSTGIEDDRVTRIGRFIRKYRIDEMPQFYDVLNGNMSFIGPRPERPEIAAEYCRVLPEFSLRLQVKAGLTGYSQVYGKYNTSPDAKLHMDLMYIAHQSISLDIQILFATIKILFQPESTEGVKKGQITAEAGTNSVPVKQIK